MTETLSDIPTRRPFDWRTAVENFGPLPVLIILAAVTIVCERLLTGESNFLKPENLLNILRQWSFIGIVSVGMTIVIISGGIDLSVGSLVAMAGGCGIWLMNTALNAGPMIEGNTLDSGFRVGIAHVFQALHLSGSEAIGVAIGFAGCVLIATICGWLAGIIIAKGRIAPFVATLGLLAVYRSIALSMADGGEFRSGSAHLFSSVGTTGIHLGATAAGVGLELGWMVVAFAAAAVVAAYLLNKTRFGRYVYAIGSNERAAIYSAIAVDRVKIWTYTLMGVCCGIAALLLGSYMNSIASSSTGNLYELDAIAAVVIGGTRLEGGSGSIRGTVIGVLILGVISNMLGILDVSPYLQGTVKGGIIIVAVLLQQIGRKK